MKKRNINKEKNYITIIPIFIVICVALLSIGWSAFQSTFNISNLYATVRVDKDIRVTGVYEYSNTNSGRSNYEEYDVHSIYSSIYLPNQNSTVTYRVQVTNVGNVMQGIYDIEEIYKIVGTNTDSDLEIKSRTVTLKEALCTNQNSSLCENGSVTTFDIEIGYKANGYDGTHQTHSVTLNFDFRRVFGITYNGFGNTSGLANTMIDGDTKVITFNSTTGIPGNTTTTGATGNYNSTTHQLTLSNITLTGLNGVITVARHYKITYSGFTGNNVSSLTDNIIYTGGTIQIPSGVDYPDGVTVSNAQGNYNDQTHIITISNITDDITITASYNSSSGNTQVVVNPDGTSTATTTTTNENGSTTVTVINYDTNGSPTTGSNTTTDTSNNVNTQTIEYDAQGNPVVTGYTINTTNNTSGGETISGGLDTGMLVFDGHNWEATLTAKFTLDNTSTSLSPIINCSSKADGRLDGVIIYTWKTVATGCYNESGSSWSSSGSSDRGFRFKTNKYTNGTLSSDSIVFYHKTTTAYYSKIFSTKTTPLTLTFYVKCENNVVSAEIRYNNQVIAKPRSGRTYTFNNMADVTFELGKFTSQSNTEPSYYNFEVISFDVHRTS